MRAVLCAAVGGEESASQCHRAALRCRSSALLPWGRERGEMGRDGGHGAGEGDGGRGGWM